MKRSLTRSSTEEPHVTSLEVNSNCILASDKKTTLTKLQSIRPRSGCRSRFSLADLHLARKRRITPGMSGCAIVTDGIGLRGPIDTNARARISHPEFSIQA